MFLEILEILGAIVLVVAIGGYIIIGPLSANSAGEPIFERKTVLSIPCRLVVCHPEDPLLCKVLVGKIINGILWLGYFFWRIITMPFPKQAEDMFYKPAASIIRSFLMGVVSVVGFAASYAWFDNAELGTWEKLGSQIALGICGMLGLVCAAVFLMALLSVIGNFFWREIEMFFGSSKKLEDKIADLEKAMETLQKANTELRTLVDQQKTTAEQSAVNAEGKLAEAINRVIERAVEAKIEPASKKAITALAKETPLIFKESLNGLEGRVSGKMAEELAKQTNFLTILSSQLANRYREVHPNWEAEIFVEAAKQVKVNGAVNLVDIQESLNSQANAVTTLQASNKSLAERLTDLEKLSDNANNNGSKGGLRHVNCGARRL